jgi:hypothetical protein
MDFTGKKYPAKGFLERIFAIEVAGLYYSRLMVKWEGLKSV